MIGNRIPKEHDLFYSLDYYREHVFNFHAGLKIERETEHGTELVDYNREVFTEDLRRAVMFHSKTEADAKEVKQRIADIKNDIARVYGTVYAPPKLDEPYQRLVKDVISKGREVLRYNLYQPTGYIPRKGEWPTIETYLRHMTQRKYLYYLDCLRWRFKDPYQLLHPHMFASKEQGTGKSTINILHKLLFGRGNVLFAGQNQLESPFNGKLEGKIEAMFDDLNTVRPEYYAIIKQMTTAKVLEYNNKHENTHTGRNFCHLTITTNNPDNCLNVGQHDTRVIPFFVRGQWPEALRGIDLEDAMEKEVPAFAHFLMTTSLEYPDVKSRFVHDYEEIMGIELADWRYRQQDSLCIALEDLLQKWAPKAHELGEEYIGITQSDLRTMIQKEAKEKVSKNEVNDRVLGPWEKEGKVRRDIEPKGGALKTSRPISLNVQDGIPQELVKGVSGRFLLFPVNKFL